MILTLASCTEPIVRINRVCSPRDERDCQGGVAVTGNQGFHDELAGFPILKKPASSLLKPRPICAGVSHALNTSGSAVYSL